MAFLPGHRTASPPCLELSAKCEMTKKDNVHLCSTNPPLQGLACDTGAVTSKKGMTDPEFQQLDNVDLVLY